MVTGPISGFLDAKGGRMDSVVIERQYSEGAVLEIIFMKKNIFFHENNSTRLTVLLAYCPPKRSKKVIISSQVLNSSLPKSNVVPRKSSCSLLLIR